MREHVVILGDGQMALVLADALAYRGVATRIWSPFEETGRQLRETRENADRMEGFYLDEAVEVVTDDARAFADATIIVNAIPAQYVRRVWKRLADDSPTGVPVACVTKGIENDTLLRPTQIIADVLQEDEHGRGHCVLSGPTIAKELAQHMPATMVAASHDQALSKRVQQMFDVPWLRVYSNDDPIGVELAGAAKNVIALAAGMIDGLGVGYNAKSALLARGLAEIARLGCALGGKKETFFGVAGVGDLATTCFSPLGRNRTCGERIGRGESLDHILKTTVSVIEGVPTARSIVQLAQQHDVDMPITRAVHAILFEQLDPKEAIEQLMHRAQKAERIG